MEDTAPRPVFPVQRFVLITLGMLVLLMMFDPGARSALAGGASVILDPVLGFGGTFPVFTFLGAALLTSLVSTATRHYFMDWVQMARFQKTSSALNKERWDAMKSGNMAKLNKLKEHQAEMAQASFKNLGSQMKSMAVTLFLILIIFSWMATFVATQAASPLVSVPWAASVDLNAATVLPHWILLYGLFSSPFGMLFGRALKYFSFTRALERREAEASAG